MEWVLTLAQLLTALGVFGTMLLQWRIRGQLRRTETKLDEVHSATNGIQDKIDAAFGAGLKQGREETQGN